MNRTPLESFRSAYRQLRDLIWDNRNLIDDDLMQEFRSVFEQQDGEMEEIFKNLEKDLSK